MGKSRVAPIKNKPSIPRLELMAATLSAKIGSKIKKEIQLKINYEIYWTDSQVVLGYINNKSKRFKIFVANRVTLINELTNAEDWHYVDSKDNPADEASRGVDPKRWKKSKWFEGPSFLWKKDLPSNKIVKCEPTLNEDILNNKPLNGYDVIFKGTNELNEVNELTVVNFTLDTNDIRY